MQATLVRWVWAEKGATADYNHDKCDLLSPENVDKMNNNFFGFLISAK